MKQTLPTAAQVAIRRSMRVLSPIPPMTSELGKFWKQPNRREIEIDDKYALLSQAAFNELADYTSSQPSGVYPGKMWRQRFITLWPIEPRRGKGVGVWYLCWFGLSHDPDKCSNHYRRILIS